MRWKQANLGSAQQKGGSDQGAHCPYGAPQKPGVNGAGGSAGGNGGANGGHGGMQWAHRPQGCRSWTSHCRAHDIHQHGRSTRSDIGACARIQHLHMHVAQHTACAHAHQTRKSHRSAHTVHSLHHASHRCARLRRACGRTSRINSDRMCAPKPATIGRGARRPRAAHQRRTSRETKTEGQKERKTLVIF